MMAYMPGDVTYYVQQEIIKNMATPPPSTRLAAFREVHPPQVTVRPADVPDYSRYYEDPNYVLPASAPQDQTPPNPWKEVAFKDPSVTGAEDIKNLLMLLVIMIFLSAYGAFGR